MVESSAGGHLEAAVAGDDPDVFFGAGGLGSDGGGEGEAHGAETAGGDEGAGGRRGLKYWASHIWCWPTSVTMMVSRSRPAALASRQMSWMTWAA